MKTEELKAKGLTEEQISFVMAENGKDIKKAKDDLKAMTDDRDQWKSKAETAEDALNKFDGIEPDKIRAELDEWKQKAADAEKEAQKQIAERDFADALKAELDGISFSSEAAKRAITAEIKGAGLTLKNGKILGLNDLITQLKESDASAFVDDSAEKAKQQQAKFTQPVEGQRTPGAVTKEDFRKMSLDERIALKARDPETYASLRG